MDEKKVKKRKLSKKAKIILFFIFLIIIGISVFLILNNNKKEVKDKPPIKTTKKVEKKEEQVKIVDLNAETAEYLNYRNIINGNLYKGCRIGKGEAAAITLAYENKGILASNNFKDIKFYVDYFELPLLTTAYLLGILFDKNIINKDEANSMWNKMIKYRRALPESSFEIYYNNLYKKDYDDFGKRIEF